MTVAIPAIKFNAGEISPRVRGRSDLDWYAAGLEIELNAISQPHGPASMRPGSWHPGSPRVPAGVEGTTRLIAFIAQVDPLQAYVVEATDRKLRFWYADTRLPVGAPFELVSPWLAADLAAIRVVRSRDVMWMIHPLYPPQKLSRTAVDTFAIAPVVFVDGPYYPENVGATTITSAATAVGAGVAWTASADLWLATDVGRLWRIGSGASWGYAKITGFSDTTHVTVEILTALPTAGPTKSWRAGLWSDRAGWPSCGCLYQERLFYGSNPAASFARADGSASGDFDKFTPGSADADSVGYLLASDELPILRDLVPNRALVALMSSSEQKIGNERATEALTTANPPQIIPISEEGVYNTPALKLKGGILFVQRYGRSIHEIAYSVDADGLKTREVSIRGDHIGDRAPFAGMAWQNRPHNILWMWSQNGALSGMTYTPEQTVIAMHRHRMGGNYQGGGARVESMCNVPGSRSDEVWAVVRRTIGGADVRHLAVLADALHDNEPQDEACYLDAAVRQRGTAPAANITFSDITDTTVRVTADAAVFSTPASIGKRIFAVLEDRDNEAVDGQLIWNRVDLEIASYVSTTVVIADLRSTWLPPSMRIATGEWRHGITEITGLGHLEGETVGVMSDGAPLEERVVSGGMVTLDAPAATAIAGLPYDMVFQPVEFDAGARQGTARTRHKRVSALGLQMVRSGPFRAGIAGGDLYDAETRFASDPMDEAVPLFTGTYVLDIPSGEDERRTRWRVEARGPLPVTIACAVPHQAVGEASQ